jgi:hypothetical protein
MVLAQVTIGVFDGFKVRFRRSRHPTSASSLREDAAELQVRFSALDLYLIGGFLIAQRKGICLARSVVQ